MRALLTGPGLADDHLARLRASGIDPDYREQVAQDELAAALASAQGYLLGGDERLDAAAIAAAPALRCVSLVGSGMAAFVDVDAAQRRGIRLANTPGVTASAVAEHAIGLLLALTRNVAAGNDLVKRDGPALRDGRPLHRSTIGIVGLGAIGTAVARILRGGFGAEVRHVSRTPKPALEAELGVTRAGSLAELCAECDAIVVCCTVDPSTRGLIGAEALAAADGLTLVNVAGAAVVDAGVLGAALDEGRVRAAGLDGYWQEPPPAPADDPYALLARPDAQLVVTPHIAAKAVGVWDAMVDRAVANLIALATERPSG